MAGYRAAALKSRKAIAFSGQVYGFACFVQLMQPV